MPISSEEKDELENLFSKFERKLAMKMAEYEGRLAQMEG